MATVFYATREDVKRALDSKATARDNGQIDRALEAATAAIYGLTHRRFYPWTGTRSVDWPNYQYARPWRLWLDANEVASVTALVSGGLAITGFYLRRGDDLDEAPYTYIELNIGSNSAFSSGSTHQRAVAITGVFAGCPVDEVPAGVLAEVLDSTETGVDVTDSSTIGVGSIVRVDSERMTVTGRSMLDTGVNIDAADSLTASTADVSITMSTTTNAPTVDEVILIDSERMLVVDVAGAVLTVKRQWDGSVLAAHPGGADIYAPRTLIVERGALGTTAATHLTAAPVYRFRPPGLVRNLAVAEAMSTLLQEGSGYARTAGSGENEHEVSGRGIKGLREDVYTAHGRKARISAI